MDDFMMFKYLKENGMFDHGSIMNKCLKYMEENQWRTALPAKEDTLRMDSIEHFDCTTAKHLVSSMYHSEEGRKYVGEKFCMDKAKEVCEKHRSHLHDSITAADIYVAINALYHDYAKLFKQWFSHDVESKIIESAILFWFMDDDYKGHNKLMNYFGVH